MVVIGCKLEWGENPRGKAKKKAPGVSRGPLFHICYVVIICLIQYLAGVYHAAGESWEIHRITEAGSYGCNGVMSLR